LAWERLAKPSSGHIARLWAKGEVLRILDREAKDNWGAAIELAATYQIITPVSGAVVLENAQQYEANVLTPVAPSSVPTIPEPEVWALLIVALLLILWFRFRHRIHLAIERKSDGV
ncbi:MAG: hypothetical protein O7E52_01420, partial [Candidatus Poribacteria bacterium]|nr:hypothetical protein [Candidatus Poribacteria bacterium]